MCSSSDIVVYGLCFCLDIIPNIVECLEGGFAMDGSEVIFI